MSFTASPLDAATNVGSASADVAAGHILGNETVTGTAGSADKLTFTTATGAAGFNFTTAGAVAGGASVTGFEQLVLANGTNSITMAGAIVATATPGSYNVITGGTGYDQITVTAANQAINLSTVTGIEQINAAGANTYTLSGAAVNGLLIADGANGSTTTLGNFVGNSLMVSSTGNAIVNKNAASTNIDTVTVTAGSTVTTNVDVVNTAAGAASTLTLTGAAGATQTVNAGGVLTAITLSAAQQTVNLKTGTGAGADVINTAASNTVANLATVDTISGFAFGTDRLNVTNAGAGQDTWSVSLGAGSTAATFVADVNAALNAITGYAAAAGLGDGILVTIASGSALAGTYLISDTTAGAGIDTTAEIVKLTGTTGTFSAAIDLI